METLGGSHGNKRMAGEGMADEKLSDGTLAMVISYYVGYFRIAGAKQCSKYGVVVLECTKRERPKR